MTRSMLLCAACLMVVFSVGAPLILTLAGWLAWPMNPGPDPAEPPISQATRKKAIQGKNHNQTNLLLREMLHQLHSEATIHFINQRGMGIGRMMPFASVMPRAWKVPEWSSEELAKEPPPLKGRKDLELIHRDTVTNFAGSNTKTPQRRFNSLYAMGGLRGVNRPAMAQLWEIKSLDLVGVVMHDVPVVYVTEKLPKMKDLAKTPTRDLDLFESEGLQELFDGKKLYVRSKDGTIRVLGPLHAGKACLKCHRDSKENDLLGAFSYTLREGLYQLNGRGAPIGAPTRAKPASKK